MSLQRYYTLAILTDGQWHAEFGDYDREAVLDERECYTDDAHPDGVTSRNSKVVKSHDSQASIDAAIARLNA